MRLCIVATWDLMLVFYLFFWWFATFFKTDKFFLFCFVSNKYTEKLRIFAPSPRGEKKAHHGFVFFYCFIAYSSCSFIDPKPEAPEPHMTFMSLLWLS